MAPVSVYIVNQPAVGFLKIGTAADTQKRLKQLQVGNPYPLILAHTVSFSSRIKAVQVEFRAHESLTPCRLTGEWFCCDVEAAIRAIEKAVSYVNNRRGNIGYQLGNLRRRDLGRAYER